jgi:hypothetical protein
MGRRCPVAPPPPPAVAAVWRVVVERAGQPEAWLGRAPRTATSVQAAIQAKNYYTVLWIQIRSHLAVLDTNTDPDPGAWKSEID